MASKMDEIKQPTELETLKELGNIGVGNASTALSKMIGKKIDITIPDARFIELEKFSELMGGAEAVIHGIYLNLEGDLKGQNMFAFPDKDALEFADLLMMQNVGTTKKLEGDTLSAFNEMANIFVGSFLNAISDMLNLKLMPGIPQYGNDMAQALLDVILAEVGQSSDKLLFIQTDFSIEGHNIQGSFLMIFNPESMSKLISTIEEVYGISISAE